MPASSGPPLPHGDVAAVGGQGVPRPPLLDGQPGQVLLGAGGEGLGHRPALMPGPSPWPPRRRRARPTPRMVAASTMVPSSTRCVEPAQWYLDDPHEPLLDPLPVDGHRGEPGGHEDAGELVAEAGGDGAPGEQGQLGGGGSRPPRPARGGRRHRRLTLDVAGAGGELEEPPVDGGTVLEDQHHRVVVGDGHHGHGARDGGPRHDRRPPVGVGEVARVRVMAHPRWITSSPVWRNCGRSRSIQARLVPGGGPVSRRHRCRADVGRGPRHGPGRHRPARGRGDGAGSGRLLNSGWAWVPTQNGMAGKLDELDQPVSGRHARADRARPLRAGIR